MYAEDDTGKLTAAERHQYPATRLDPMDQGRRQGIGERLVQWDWKADVAESDGVGDRKSGH
jgi:hypothetical protein